MQGLSNKRCPCCSGKSYKECCEPYHEGTLPETAQQLMRSRYSAYALNRPDYIMTTTHPENPHYSKNKMIWRKSIIEFSQESIFEKLVIHKSSEKANTAKVTFTAYITQDNQDATFTERSTFEKLDGRWLYRSGEMR